MTTMSAVWDRSVMVLQGRGRMLAGIAALTLFAPAVVRAGAGALFDPASPATGLLIGLIGLATVAVSLWGQLALIAAASDPAVLAPDAWRMAARRLPAAIGLALIALLVIALLFAPAGVAMMRAGLDMKAMAAGGATGGDTTVPPAIAGFVGLYTLVLVVAALIVGARLAVLYPVILLERSGIGAFARAFRLTRGHTWRIFGVLLLYIVVLLVASGAARLVLGTIAALLFGPGAVATFVAVVAAALVTAALSTVAVVFTAQLYVALRDERAGV